MRLLELTLPDPAANIALDEALLEEAEALGDSAEFVRLWESPTPMVVIGRSSKIDEEVERAECARLGIPVIRRSSGGAAVVAGPGCYMYAVVLSYARRPPLAQLDEAHRGVLEPLAAALRSQCPDVLRAGISDLAAADRKFSGNSLRCKRTHFLYHGTFLYGFDIELVGRLLKTAPRQPEYRRGRSHAQFVANLPLPRDAFRAAVLAAFPPAESVTDWPQARVEQLLAEKYSQAEWNARL